MNDDTPFLRAFVADGSDWAFSHLVRRHINLVYGVCLRRLNGDTAQAADVTQRVFIDLARKAAELPPDIILGGWLHRHASFTASKHVRSEVRRKQREQESIAMHQLGPELDAALDELAADERDVLVLRFFEQRDLRSVGEVLGLSDDAAQKRVARALERLRAIFARRSHAVTTLALAAVLSQTCSMAAPAGLVSASTSAALIATGMGAATAAASTSTSGKALLQILIMNKTKLTVGTIISACVITTALYQQHQITQRTLENQRLHDEMNSLRREQEALDETNRELKDGAAQAQVDRDELMRLRRMIASNAKPAGAIPTSRPPASPVSAKNNQFDTAGQSDTADQTTIQTNTLYSGSVRASVPVGHALIAGGWSTNPKMRALELVTPTIVPGENGGNPKVSLAVSMIVIGPP
jgi:RNA polymerase sigma factor (sigma-70 family)